MADLWTIDELTDLAQQALNLGEYDGQTSGRVREVPDARTIRYYTTLGLIDPPAEMRGRKAYYSRRHVIQLAAIKQLQARGYTLPQVQQALLGADARTLARWAGLPAKFWDSAASRLPEPPVARAAASKSQASSGSSRFWAEPVAARQAAAAALPSVRAAIHLPVCTGVELVIQNANAMDAAMLGRLSPLLAQLAEALQDSQGNGESAETG